ncbi:hypothetical protein B0H34DRAFT_717780 [Crassisporium funariophilum]|nr:hypothetical protein B0H34DRAFT_717780 [Crassisporium funariophilum]
MRNIREYHIDWDETRPYHPEHYQAFLTPVLEKWTDLLVKLTIKVPPQILKSLAKVHLRKLEILEYHFSTGMMAFKDIDDAHDGFLVFVNNLRDSLQAISFSSTHTSQNLDMSRIYRLLGTFPKLNSVSLSIPFDGGHLCDPKTLIRFLEKHRSTLKNLNLFTSRCTVHVTPSDPECILWIQHILASVHTPFPQFRGLGIALRPLRAPLDALYRFLSMHSSTLHSLILTDRKLGCHELWKTVSETVDLRHLRLKLDGLCPELLFDLASSLPGLQSLRIECSKLHVHSRSRTRIWEDDKKNFREEMIRNKPRVERWGLQLMAIGPAEFHLARDLERALVECMPNLTVSDLVVQ